MSSLFVNFSSPKGRMKIMHSVNNVPAGDSIRAAGMGSQKYYIEAGIPYCRSHDAGFNEGYCGEYAVDVHRIFRNFDADENEPSSYDFEYTDKYVKSAEDVGAHVFYRLGASIEHRKKVGTIPPKDFSKWARICEHIIRHYNEGWADGFNYGLEYWEIWNEPECKNADGSTPCWQGTEEQFTELFVTTVKHLKSCFPDIKVGGPAFCSSYNDRYNHRIFDALVKAGVMIDFYSFHGYYNNPTKYIDAGQHAYDLLREYGLENKVELILNEWNYVRKWTGEDFRHSVYAIRGLKGSSYIAGTMAAGQASKIDHMMYYDARPCSWNGIFDPILFTPFKGFYPFKMYGEMYRLGEQIETVSDDATVYAVGAKGDGTGALMTTYFDDSDDALGKEIELTLTGLPAGEKTVEYHLLDETHDDELVRTDVTTSETLKTVLKTGVYTTWFIRVTTK